MPTDRSEQLPVDNRPDALGFITDGDPFDHFPWTVTLYSQEFQDLPAGHRKAFISTPNGKRIDNGEQHTYWSIAGDLWEPTAVLIAKCVNLEASRRFGTPNPSSVYVDEWRKAPGNPYAEYTDCPICPMLATDRDDALGEAEALRRRDKAWAADVVWRANWMTKAVNLLGEIREALEHELGESGHLAELEDLLHEEFDDGEADDE